jgi:iron complex outermembrane receptor protein
MKRFVLASIALVAPHLALAQELPSDIIVTAASGPQRVRSATITLNREAIDERTPAAVADLFRSISGLSLRTNSRGETVIRVRGAEERQTAVFLDGAPLATPWDGRIDLSLLPAGLIGGIEVVKGASPIEYGANTVGGVVDLRTILASDTLAVQGEAQTGTYGLLNASALASLPLDDKFSLVTGVSLLKRDAERIADRLSVPFDPSLSRRRSNTDLSARSLFFAGGYEAGPLALRVSLLRADVTRGIPAQGDLDPAVSMPRYWRTPDWHLTQLTGTVRWAMSDDATLRLTGWRQWFDQTIDAYSDASYTLLRSREDDRDLTSGLRAVVTFGTGATTVRLSGTVQTSTHRQIDSRTATGLALDFSASSALLFRQRLFSTGVEFDRKFGDEVKASIAFSIDRADTPLTGDKPAQPAQTSPGFVGALRWTALPTLSATTSLGWRNRFPSSRELFGESLGRFLANPDLKPERALLGDVTLAWRPTDTVDFNSTVWFSDAADTLAQRIISVGTVNRRQRFNTRGSFTYGWETTATARITDKVRAEFSLALQNGRSKAEADGTRQPLVQRPERQLVAALDWNATHALDVRAEVLTVGPATDLGDTGGFARLPGATSLNFRAFWKIADVKTVGTLTLTASLTNATDALILPQLGLPAPGRTFTVGLRLTPNREDIGRSGKSLQP